jgi:hypothetical protein
MARKPLFSKYFSTHSYARNSAGKVIAIMLPGGFRQATTSRVFKENHWRGAIMFEENDYLVESGVIYTDELEIEEAEEIIAPGSLVGN